MDTLLYGYQVNGPTWAYLSALLAAAVYFRFGRVWSSRNLDLVLLWSLAPGVLMARGEAYRTAGFVWLMVVTALLVARAFVDPWQKWRPRFDQNMNEAGMLFLGVCSLLFLGARALSDPFPEATARTLARADALIERTAVEDPSPAAAAAPAVEGVDAAAGPGAPLIAVPFDWLFENAAPRALAVLAHLAIVLGLLYAGRRTFDSPKTGVAMATLYLIFPVTAYDVGAVNHLLPAALTMWAFVVHARPGRAGVLLGLAGATQVFPLLLVPVWAMYYGRAGVKKFLLGFALSLAAAAGSLVLVSEDAESFARLVLGSFYPYVQMLSAAPGAEATDAGGVWSGGPGRSMYRLPVVVAYGLLCVLFTAAPRPKTLEMLLAQSAVLVLATQFWVPGGGGLLVVWYLPLLLLLMFRPRLPDPFVVEEPTASVRAAEPARPGRGGAVKTGTLR